MSQHRVYKSHMTWVVVIGLIAVPFTILDFLFSWSGKLVPGVERLTRTLIIVDVFLAVVITTFFLRMNKFSKKKRWAITVCAMILAHLFDTVLLWFRGWAPAPYIIVFTLAVILIIGSFFYRRKSRRLQVLEAELRKLGEVANVR